MKPLNVFALLAVGTAGALLIRRAMQSTPAPKTPAPAHSPLAPVVEEVLHQHEGEDTPMVHAFEQALEEERQHEVQLAEDVGVRA